nr:MAG TPA: hypothetical protein [Caudoviricetes sp.]
MLENPQGQSAAKSLIFLKKRSTTILVVRSRAKRLEAESILYLKG